MSLDFVPRQDEIPADEIERRLARPKKGDAWLAGRDRRAKETDAENKAMRDAKVRDGRRCRFPKCEHMPKKPRIDAAHSIHRGMGGNPDGDRTKRELLIAFCFIHHRQWDRGDFDIEPRTDRLFDGPVDFTRRGEIFYSEPTYHASEERNPS